MAKTPRLSTQAYNDNTIVVGDATDVFNRSADFSSIAAAIAAASAGAKIHLLARTFTENIIIDKQIHLTGDGVDSVIDGTVTFDTGSSRSSAQMLKFGANVSVTSGVTKLILINGWIATGSTLTDNNASVADSLYTLVED